PRKPGPPPAPCPRDGRGDLAGGARHSRSGGYVPLPAVLRQRSGQEGSAMTPPEDPAPPSGGRGGTVRDALDGLRMSAGTLTAVPVPGAQVDRAVGGGAMAGASLVGAVLGLAAAAVVVAASLLGLPGLLAGLLAVGSLALLTRGLHLDGLADLADGLGS